MRFIILILFFAIIAGCSVGSRTDRNLEYIEPEYESTGTITVLELRF